jgi:hypothetical protein
MTRIRTQDDQPAGAGEPSLSAINAWAHERYGEAADGCTLRDINAWAQGGDTIRTLADLNRRVGDRRPRAILRSLADINRWAAQRWGRAR